MSLLYLDDEHVHIARLSSGEGGVNTINGNLGRPFVLYGEETCLELTPREALKMLDFLLLHREHLLQMAEEQERYPAWILSDKVERQLRKLLRIAMVGDYEEEGV